MSLVKILPRMEIVKLVIRDGVPSLAVCCIPLSEAALVVEAHI